ncbi:MAG: hypothetical protein Q9207_007230, partial [Kuettlingeria erythrocarpa]
MTTDVDYDRLRMRGVSEDAIDFLQRSLVIDPALRMTDDECLSHAWITDEKWQQRKAISPAHQNTQRGPRPPVDECSTRSTERVGTDELIMVASQLKLAHEALPSEELGNNEAMSQPERDPEAEEDLQEEEISLAEYNDDLESSDPPAHHVQQQQPRRLFGEVTQSALQSSGVLDWHARAALEVASQGNNRDPTVDESHYEGASEFSLSYDVDVDTSNQPFPPSSHHPPPPPPRDSGGPAPSLLGAEAMVDQLKMDAVMEDAPSPNSTDPATSQKTDDTRDQNEAVPNEALQSTPSSQGLYSATPPQAQLSTQPTAPYHKPTRSMQESKKHASDSIEVSASKRHEVAAGRSSAQPSVLVAAPSVEHSSTSSVHETKQHDSETTEISSRKRFKLPAGRISAHQSMTATTAHAEVTSPEHAGSIQDSKKPESDSIEVGTSKSIKPTTEKSNAHQSMAAPTTHSEGQT